MSLPDYGDLRAGGYSLGIGQTLTGEAASRINNLPLRVGRFRVRVTAGTLRFRGPVAQFGIAAATDFPVTATDTPNYLDFITEDDRQFLAFIGAGGVATIIGTDPATRDQDLTGITWA